MMSFEEYLATKKIDSDQYKVSEPTQWLQFSSIFLQMHPKSFTLQKLNLINSIRRRFPLKVVPLLNEKEPKKTARPMIKPKPATSDKPKVIMKPKTALKPKVGKPEIKAKEEVVDQGDAIAKPKMTTAGKPKMKRPVMKAKGKE